MTCTTVDPLRAKRLERAFWAFVKGTKSVLNARDAERFLEAVQSRSSAKECLEIIAANTKAIEAVANSVRTDLSPAFLSNTVIPFLSFMSAPEVKAIYEGRLLQKLVSAIVLPPTFWNAFVSLYIENGLLGGDGDVKVFAWLCLEIAMHPGPELSGVVAELATTLERAPLLVHSNSSIRDLGYRIQKVMQLRGNSAAATGIETAGGRHDNDFADFRDVAIYPTKDELTTALTPFYRRAAEVEAAKPDEKAAIHLDNQFRLLREDMLAELREDLQQAFSNRKKGRHASIFRGLHPQGLDTGDFHHSRLPSLAVSVSGGLEILQNVPVDKRKTFLIDNKRIAPHKGFGVLCRDTEVVGFAFIVRDIDRLCEDPPVLGLQFPSANILTTSLTALLASNDMRFVVVDTPVFAYEPILERLKDILELPLEHEILRLPGMPEKFEPAEQSSAIIEKVGSMKDDGCALRVNGRLVRLDKSQRDALLYALSQAVSVIQGPPGTGKSFIGALAAHVLHQNEDSRILVLSFTNHALDQFLEDITKVGIGADSVVRLGSKSTEATARFSFEALFKGSENRRTQGSSSLLINGKRALEDLRDELGPLFTKVARKEVTLMDILEYLEFSDTYTLFWSAFQLPADQDEFQTAGKRGKGVKADHLIERWAQGQNAGWAWDSVPVECQSIWSIPIDRRTSIMDIWASEVIKENVENLRDVLKRTEASHKAIESVYTEARCDFIRTKRVVGCTTTGAAMYSNLIKAFKPDCVLVEEAGEILEAHVLTALHSDTKQLILIGDHKQLRPKVNSYKLSVEKGEGYDLNRSMFERLILRGHPVKTLSKQHRMVPEISQLVREITYPDLLDDEKTLDREKMRGVLGRVTFINHDKVKVDASELRDKKDGEFTASKRNEFEARMVLKLVKFLGQQGYKTKDIVVLTPYLGQLKLLREMLSHDTDPWLSDLDNFELKRAGLINNAAAKLGQGRIRLSTIDNYQGEESDIVIASLCRSNSKGDIGFMKAPERLNVLISRARNCLILIGNMTTFMASPQGRDV